jgi:hypothetical protein
MRSAYDFPRLFGLVPQAGTLDEGQAKYQIRVMEEIVRTLTRLDVEQRQLSLFGTGCSVGLVRVSGTSKPHEPLH